MTADDAELDRLDKSEDELRPLVSRGAHAQALLDDDMVKEAFDGLEAGYINLWRLTEKEETDKREDCWRCLYLLAGLRQSFRRHINSGKAALKYLEDDMKRRDHLERR